MSIPLSRLTVPAATLATLSGIALSGAAGCGTPEPETGTDDRPSVVASTDVWASVVRAVAGDAVTITTIIDDPAGDPHSYEAAPADAAEVAEADLVVVNGGGYDEFMTQLLEQTGTKPTVDAVTVATEGARSTGGPVNEHVWYDLPVVRDVARQVADELGTLVPGRAEGFGAAAETFAAGVDDLNATVSAIAEQHAGTRVAMTEPVAYSLVEAAELDDVTPSEFVEAVEEETDPPAAAVAAVGELITQRQVQVLIYNPQTGTPVTEQVRATAEAAGIPVVELLETLPDGAEYLGWMSAQIESLAGALG